MIKIALLLLICTFLHSAKPELLLLKTYKDQNITDWVMSEKLDGIRAYWDGKNLISRGGKIIHAPAWFTEKYPPFKIDGELWSQRGDFEYISSVVRDKVPSDSWRYIAHYIFEIPDTDGDLFQRLSKLKPYESDIIKRTPQIAIKDRSHLDAFIEEVKLKGGEGVVVRDPTAPYIASRTSRALKITSYQDSECRVVEYIEGRGKYKGLLGALRCRLNSGLLFKIGSGFTDAQRADPPAIGSVVLFKHKGLTKYKKPRFPIFLKLKNAQ